MDSSSPWRGDVLRKLKKRNRQEITPFKALFVEQAKIFEENKQLQAANSHLSFVNEKLKQENIQLEASVRVSSASNQIVDSLNMQELQKKMFSLQEELTEMHRRKGENAQQVIDLSAALKVTEKEIAEKQIKIESLEAEILILKQDLKFSEGNSGELESTNQLLKDEYQALQLALNTAESKLVTVQKENQLLVSQLLDLKAQDAERMNFENDLVLWKTQQNLQKELAEAIREGKSVSPDSNERHGFSQPACAGVSVPTKAAFMFDAHDGEVMTVKWDFSGHYCATAGSDRKIKIWEMSVGMQSECRATLTGSNAAVMGVDFDTNGTMLLGASNDFATRVWTVEDCRLRHTLTGHSGKVMSAKFFGDATRVVSGSHDRTLKIWDLRSKACTSTKFAGSSCNDVVTTDLSVISAHFDKKVRFWDIRTSSSEPSQEMTFGGKVTSLDLSRDKNYLGVCSRDDVVKVMDLRMNRTVGTCSGEGFHVGCDWSRVSFSPDGEFISCGSGDGSVYIWNVLTGQLYPILRGHTTGVNAVSWHPGGLCLVSVDKAKTCYVWSDYL